MASGSKAIMLQQRPQHPTVTATPHYPSLRTNPTNTALSLAMHYILGSLVKGSWIAPHPHHQLDFPHYLPPHSPTQKSAIRVNSGFFIFNSQHSSKWCPVVKQ